MTEEEMKTKRCCGPVGCGDARPDGSWMPVAGEAALPIINRFCIGSACMAWRWGVEYPKGCFVEFVPNQAIAERRANDMNYVVGGYCGLAGKP